MTGHQQIECGARVGAAAGGFCVRRVCGAWGLDRRTVDCWPLCRGHWNDGMAGHKAAYRERSGCTENVVCRPFTESAAGFSSDVGNQDEGYFDALVHMFEQALKATCQLSAGDRDTLIVRLDRVRTISHSFGYGVGDDMDGMLAKYVHT